MHDVHDPISPNCCTVTIVEYSSTDVTLLRSCLSVLSEHVASQSKWQSADLDFLKLAKRKSVCSARQDFRITPYIYYAYSSLFNLTIA